MLKDSDVATKVNKELLDKLKTDHRSEVTFSLNSSKRTRGTLATFDQSQKSKLASKKEESSRSAKSAVGGLTKCDVCNDAITDHKDIELNTRVSHMMRKEARLRHLYNEFRQSRGLPAADFDILKFPNRSITI